MKKIAKVFLAALMVTMIISGCSSGPTAQDRFEQYINLWKQQKFAKMYDFLSKDAKKSISKEQFVSRYQKIYQDLEITGISIKVKKPTDDKAADLTYTAKMNSVAGKIEFTNKAHLTKEGKTWNVKWNTTYIFPQLKGDDKIGFSSTEPERGQILDRNGDPLATNGQAYEVGVVPEKMGDQKDYVINQLSNLLQMPAEEITKEISASWVKPEYFVPLKKVAMDDQARIAQLIALAPVQTKKVNARIYPLKEAAAQLVGYVGPITADELTKLKGKGYTDSDDIGKRGLEQLYDQELKGQAGVKVTIKKADGSEEVLAEKPVKNGKNITLTIDATVQEKIFAGMNGEAGTSAALNPATGETLALVSSPSFDPNKASLGFSAAEWKDLQDNPQKPLDTRFKLTYAPGSTMKPITAAIGLSAKAFDPEQNVEISGAKWRKDKSWGNYYVTRVHESSPVNLEKALFLSDNIYFAQTALKIGKTAFIGGLKKYGFGETLDYPFPLEKSTYGKLDTEIALADSGYGQGQMQMSIVHLLAAYTPMVNKGNMIKPVLLMGDKKNQIWKSQVISSSNSSLLSGILRKVVDDPSGTAHAAQIPGYPLAGKTGTAEIKQKQGQTGAENGWFVAYNPTAPNLLIGMMIENVQERGGSQIPVKIVKSIFEGLK